MRDGRGQASIASNGGAQAVANKQPRMLAEGFNTLPEGLDVYAASFFDTLPDQDRHDGLLRQWRDYGSDGGFASFDVI